MKALRKEFYIQIRKTFGRFLSLLLIVALGVAFYAGIRSTEPDMRKSVDAIYDHENDYDIRIVSALGVTKQDIAQLEKINQIKEIEGVYNIDQVVNDGSTEFTLRLMSKNEVVNQVQTDVPTFAENECLVDQQLVDREYIHIGDRLTFKNEYVKQESYIVKGTFCSGNYLSFNKGSSTEGAGILEGLVLLNKNQFCMDNFTDLYITVEGAKELDSYADNYHDLIQEVVDEIKKIAPEREQVRYDTLVNEAMEEIESAQNELDKKSEDYKDGLQKVKDGQSEISEKRKKLKDAENELVKQEEQYQQGVEQYQEGKKKYESARKELKRGKKQYQKGKKQYEKGKEQFVSGKNELESAKKQLEVSKQQAIFMGMSEVPQVKEQLESAEAEIAVNEAKINQAEKKLEKSKNKLAKAKKKLTKGNKKLKASKKVLDETKKKLESAEKQLADGKQEIEEGKKELDKAQKKIDKSSSKLGKAEKKIKKANRKIERAREDVASIKKAEWYILDRDTVVSFVSFGQDAERIGNIGKVFPIIFFLVAAMVSLTTMTRMVEEERVQIGTLKALGYGKMSIAGKYIMYGSMATLVGGIAGGIIGSKSLPWIIITAYRLMYQNLYMIEIPLNMQHFVTACMAAFVSVVGATIFACYKALMAQPAQLMQPEAPKAGKRVLLERIPFLWNHFSFNIKSTFRNLFRYKKRLIMTLFGIGGCMALMLVGFGIKNSINSILTIQFGELFHYDVTVTYDETYVKEHGTDKLTQTFETNEKTDQCLQAYVFTCDVGKETETVSTYLLVPERTEEIADYITFQSRTKKEQYRLTDDGVMISEKLAKKINAKVGETIYFKESETKRYQVKVKAIVENYSYHYMYMTKDYYQQVCGNAPVVNTAFLKLKNGREIDEQLGNEWMATKGVVGVSFLQTTYDTFQNMMKAMDAVIIVLVLSAGLLAFIVLYNLNNVNIAERRRELATFKVLGFYDLEVSGYIYRENIIITVMGMLLGALFGIVLHQFVIQTAEIDIMMFGREIGTAGYIYSILLTILFAVLINASMHFKLKKVDMATSLKSGE